MTTNDTDDFDMDFAGLDTFVSSTPRKAKAEDTFDYRGAAFERVRASYEAKQDKEAVSAPTSVRYVGFNRPMSHVWALTSGGWIRVSTKRTRMESSEQAEIIERAAMAYPGCDLGVSAQKGWL